MAGSFHTHLSPGAGDSADMWLVGHRSAQVQ